MSLPRFLTRSWDHPRLRGEYVFRHTRRVPAIGSPPLARGIHPFAAAPVCCAGITPACAGNTFVQNTPDGTTEDHPRLRGEYCIFNWIGSTSRGITPACAGNTVYIGERLCNRWDHPRLRGEYSANRSATSAFTGSPPLARGILNNTVDFSGCSGITPACAGNTAGGAPDLRCNRDHPRLRGEYLFQRYNGLHSAGSPPLARGILTMLMIQDGIEGITPACAGNTHGGIYHG